MKKIILIVVALLLLGGIGGAAYMFFEQSAVASVSPGDLSKQAEKEAADKEKAERDAKTAFVKMDPLTLPVVGDKGVIQIVNISVTLEVVDQESAKEVEKVLPRLKDAYIQDMYGILGRKGAVNAEGILEVNKVKARLNRITEKVIGEGKVRDVLIQAIQQRPV